MQLPWRIPLALAVSLFVHYLDRNLIALALPAMAHDFGWGDRDIGRHGEWLLGAFFLTYGLAQMALAGPAERFGPKRSLIAVVVGFSLVTIAQGAAGFAGSLAMLIVLRALLGLAESVHVPMMSAITSRHFPPAVRARANSTWSVGLIAATALGPVITVPLISRLGWAQAFVIVGAAGLLVSLPALARALPADGVAGAVERGERAFLRRPDYWLYVLCCALNAFCAFGILGWLPTYFNRAKGIDFAALGWPLAIVFTTGIVGTLGLAALGDALGQRVRLAAVGFAAAAALLGAAIRAEGLVPLVALFALAVLAQSAFSAQEYATMQRLAEDRHVGAATGLCNGIALVLGGVGGSLVPGAVVAATGSFDEALFAVLMGAVAAAAAMALLAWRTRL
ncbi:MAG: putative sulfoacetate transporter SauU [Burkholderiaceae bacterium]|nr:putative sulfoacetate transporter SauU [Burkholderiaceae bacterium]